MWSGTCASEVKWNSDISNYEQKQTIARKIAGRLKDGDVVGAGSGSTSFLTLQEIGKRVAEEKIQCKIIPTSREMEMAASSLGLTVSSLLSDRPDWYYDGADEVDPSGNLIKGRGGAMFREKLVMSCARTSFILVDKSKFVSRLGEKFPVPVEVYQESLHYVDTALRDMGAKSELRLAKSKDGPVVTESGNFILDCFFSDIGKDFEKEIKAVTGVIESGLFWGYDPEIVTTD